ncbi:MAG: hypothetical protein AB1724_15210 [Thermodesulfobacteriota bacterium]
MKILIITLAMVCILLPSSVPADDAVTTTTNTMIDSRGNVLTQTIETYAPDDPAAGTGSTTFDSRGNIVNQTTQTLDPGNPFAENDDPQSDEKQTITNQPNNRRGTSNRTTTTTSVWDPTTSSYVNDPSGKGTGSRTTTQTMVWDPATSSYVPVPGAKTGNTTVDARGNIINQNVETDEEENPFAEEEDDPWAGDSRNTRNRNTRGAGSSDTLMDDLNTINNQNQNMRRR